MEEEALGRFDSSFRYLHGKALGHFRHFAWKSLDILVGIQYSCINKFSFFLLLFFLGVVCPASAIAQARLLAAHCRHSHAKVPRQCEADMSGKSVPISFISDQVSRCQGILGR